MLTKSASISQTVLFDGLLPQSSLETFRHFPVSLDHESHTQNKAIHWKPLGQVWKAITFIIF